MKIRNINSTIASGQGKSGVIDLLSATLCGVRIPAAFTGTAITFESSKTATGTFDAVKDGAGNSISKTVAASQYIALDPSLFAGIRFLKIVSGSNEAADRVVTAVARPV